MLKPTVCVCIAMLHSPDAACCVLLLLQVSEANYTAAVRKMCKAGSMPLYVASDSRAAILLFDHLCPGRIVHQYYDWSGSGSGGAGGGGGSLLLEDSSTKHGMHSEVLRSRPHLDPAITTSSSSGNSSSGNRSSGSSSNSNSNGNSGSSSHSSRVGSGTQSQPELRIV